MNGIIEMEMQPGTMVTPEDAAASLQSECELWKEADKALGAALDKDCDNLGRIFRKLKKKCLAPERDGRGWAAQLKERGLKVRTVDSWIPHAQQVKVAHPLMLRAIAAAKKKNDRIEPARSPSRRFTRARALSWDARRWPTGWAEAVSC